MTFTATVTPTVGSGACSGSVTFEEGATVLATATLAAGTATVTTTALGPGSHSITATYAGDANCNGSTTAALVLVVSKAATTTLLSVTPNVVTAGQESSAVFTATVSPVAPGGGMPTGTVTVASGATTLCTITLANATGTCNPGASALAASGVPYTITGTYNGGANFLGSSGSTTLTVITPPSPPVTSLLLTKGVASTQAGPFGASLTAAAGSTVWYRLVLTNNGSNGFAAVTLADTAAGGALPASCPAVPAPFSGGRQLHLHLQRDRRRGHHREHGHGDGQRARHRRHRDGDRDDDRSADPDALADAHPQRCHRRRREPGQPGLRDQQRGARSAGLRDLPRAPRARPSPAATWPSTRAPGRVPGPSPPDASWRPDGTVHYYRRISDWTGFWAKLDDGASHGRIGTVRH